MWQLTGEFRLSLYVRNSSHGLTDSNCVKNSARFAVCPLTGLCVKANMKLMLYHYSNTVNLSEICQLPYVAGKKNTSFSVHGTYMLPAIHQRVLKHTRVFSVTFNHRPEAVIKRKRLQSTQ